MSDVKVFRSGQQQEVFFIINQICRQGQEFVLLDFVRVRGVNFWGFNYRQKNGSELERSERSLFQIFFCGFLWVEVRVISKNVFVKEVVGVGFWGYGVGQRRMERGWLGIKREDLLGQIRFRSCRNSLGKRLRD